MTNSTHERFREPLTALKGDAAILPTVAAAGARRDWWTSDRTWRRTYGRFTPDRNAFAEMVFASDTPSPELCRVEVFDRRPDQPACRRDVCVLESEIAWARVTRFPFDSDLPGLAHIGPGATVMRYHPGRRCTLRIERLHRTVFAKVYATNHGARVYSELVDLRRAAANGELPIAIAEPLDWDPDTRTLFQSAVAGRPATEGLRGVRGEDLARRIGTAAASLTRTTVQPTEVFDGVAGIVRSRRHADELARRVPRLAPTAASIVKRLAELHARCDAGELRAIHGAPHPDHWLDTGTAIGLIDFDRFSIGDPELDAGVVLGDLDALGDAAVPTERLAAACLDGYRAAGIALREPLVQAYRAHQQLAKALRAAQAIRPDGDRKAEKFATLAERTLSAAVTV
jgi:hypothetical protein